MHNTLSLNKKSFEDSLLPKTPSTDAKLAIQHYFKSHKGKLWISFVNALLDILPLNTDTQCSPIHTCTFNVTDRSVNENLVCVSRNTIGEVEFAISMKITMNKS